VHVWQNAALKRILNQRNQRKSHFGHVLVVCYCVSVDSLIVGVYVIKPFAVTL
jgi:hypothetical protein